MRSLVLSRFMLADVCEVLAIGAYVSLRRSSTWEVKGVGCSVCAQGSQARFVQRCLEILWYGIEVEVEV